MCCGFCVLWCNDGSIDLATAVARCGSEAWMGYWGFLGGVFMSVCFVVRHGSVLSFELEWVGFGLIGLGWHGGQWWWRGGY